MNTIKTVVVTATLLAVGYGAHVVMNKPIPPESVWDELPGVNVNPNGPAIEIPELKPAPVLPDNLESDNRFAKPGSYPGPSIQPQDAMPNPIPPQSQFEPGPEGVSLIPSIDNGMGSRGVTSIQPVPQAGSSQFDAIWRTGQSYIASGQLSEALLTLSMLYKADLTESQRNLLVPLLDQLAGTVIYSRNSYRDDPWTGNAPISLEELAARNKIPSSFLSRVNGVPLGTVVPAGTALKVVQGPFRGVLELSRRELTIFLGESYAGRFNVSIGRELVVNEPMVFVVIRKDGAQQYVDPRTGQPIAAGDPTNPFGDHWIELINPTSRHSIKIHSVGSAVDASDSRGYISVSKKDAEDLQAILSINSAIRVVP